MQNAISNLVASLFLCHGTTIMLWEYCYLLHKGARAGYTGRLLQILRVIGVTGGVPYVYHNYRVFCRTGVGDDLELIRGWVGLG